MVPARRQPEQLTFALVDARILNAFVFTGMRSGFPQLPQLCAADEQVQYAHEVPVSLGKPRLHVHANGPLRIDLEHACCQLTPRIIIGWDAQQLLELSTESLHDHLVGGIGRDVDVSLGILVQLDLLQLIISYLKQES
jgi:hypothetical protein